MPVPKGWERQILGGLGAPVTPQNVKFLQAWQRAEGGGTANNANWNPLNTTQRAQGAGSINSVGVRSYVSPQQGIQATLQTLKNGYYNAIVQGLRKNIGAGALAQAVANSPWGTGGGVQRVLGSGFQGSPAQQPAQMPNAPVRRLGRQQIATVMQQTNGGTPYDNAWSLRLMDRQPLGSGNSPGQNFAQALLAGGFGQQMTTEGMLGAIMQLRSDMGNLSTEAGGFSAGGLEERIGPIPQPPKTSYSVQLTNAPSAPGGPSMPRVTKTAGGGGGGGITELFYDPLGGIKNNRAIGAIGGHSDHVHVAMPSLQAQLAVEHQARRMGMRVGEEQDATVDPVHVKTSYHYQNFPGTKWRKAADISGNPQQMAALYKWVNGRYGG